MLCFILRLVLIPFSGQMQPNTYHAIISHAFPCAGVLPHDGTGAAIDTAVSESARNASGGPTNEDSII